MDETYFLFLKFNKNFSVALGISYFEYAYCFPGEGSPYSGSVVFHYALNPRNIIGNSNINTRFHGLSTAETPRGDSMLDKFILV